ncbi:expressed unknown protein [Seminavis robusta]|uniref:Uncharacterized protein n=1 Tax=Seminavis robusta TaxID=568900 RepID=A0A9N8EKR8_9STRA|nr:expressed unknown protein [Seminavis robusta]|eukprot:Sro1143_g246000.1 n/a (591) ;mRNA; f:19678-21450
MNLPSILSIEEEEASGPSTPRRGHNRVDNDDDEKEEEEEVTVASTTASTVDSSAAYCFGWRTLHRNNKKGKAIEENEMWRKRTKRANVPSLNITTINTNGPPQTPQETPQQQHHQHHHHHQQEQQHRSSRPSNGSSSQAPHAIANTNHNNHHHNTQRSKNNTGTLRSSLLDLKVVLKWKDNDGGGGEARCLRKEYDVYSQNLAHLSRFIDRTLSSSNSSLLDKVDQFRLTPSLLTATTEDTSTYAPLAGVNVPSHDSQQSTSSSQHREVVLDEVTPHVFETALKYEMDSVAIRSMTPEDVLEVVDFYHKYEFHEGLRLCDAVVLEYFVQHLQHDHWTPPTNLDLLVDTAIMSYRLNLKNSKDYALRYLQSKLHFQPSPFGPSMFTVDHIRLLHPLFRQGILTLVDDNSSNNDSNEKDPQKQPIRLTKEEIDSPLFPRFFVTMVAHKQCSQQLLPRVVYLEGTESPSSSDNHETASSIKLVFQTDGYYPTRQHETLGIKKSVLCDNDWAIVTMAFDPKPQRQNNSSSKKNQQRPAPLGMIVYWKCPYSRSLAIPPLEPWIPVHSRAMGKSPRVTYCYDNNSSSRHSLLDND